MKPTDFSVHVTSFLTHYLAAQRNSVSTRIKGGHSHQCEGSRVESGFESLIGGDAVETLYQTLHLPTFWLACFGSGEVSR